MGFFSSFFDKSDFLFTSIPFFTTRDDVIVGGDSRQTSKKNVIRIIKLTAVFKETKASTRFISTVKQETTADKWLVESWQIPIRLKGICFQSSAFRPTVSNEMVAVILFYLLSLLELCFGCFFFASERKKKPLKSWVTLILCLTPQCTYWLYTWLASTSAWLNAQCWVCVKDLLSGPTPASWTSLIVQKVNIRSC